MTKDGALEMCLEYIEKNALERRFVRWAIKEALAQPEQEPWLLESTQSLAKSLARKFYPEVTQWECLDDLAGVISQIDNMTTGLMRKPPLPVQERNFCPRCGKRTADLTTIHTCTPPQRPWVGLTVDELIDLERKHLSHENLTRAIEAKLKEKNT